MGASALCLPGRCLARSQLKRCLSSNHFKGSKHLLKYPPTGQSWGLPRKTPNEGSVFFKAPVTHHLPIGEQTGRILQRANYRRDLPAESYVLALPSRPISISNANTGYKTKAMSLSMSSILKL